MDLPAKARQSHPRAPEFQFIKSNINEITEAPVQHAEERGTPLYTCPTFNCLSAGHRTKYCRSSGWCRKCGKTHHTSLHRDTVTAPPAEASDTQVAAEQDVATVNAAAPLSQIEPTLQMTSQVVLESPDGK